MAAKDKIETHERIRRIMYESLATNLAMDGVDLRVFLYLCARLDFEKNLHVPQIEMSVALDRRKPHISRSMKKLADEGVILPGPKGPRSSEWRLNPDYGGK
jgi:hypothetical protein